MKSLLVPPDSTESPAMGAVQRGITEGALKPTNDGSSNYKTFGKQWNNIPNDYRKAGYTPTQYAKLSSIADTSNALFDNANPNDAPKSAQTSSVKLPLGAAVGAALLGHPALGAEGAALTLGYHGAQRLISKAMTSP